LEKDDRYKKRNAHPGRQKEIREVGLKETPTKF